MQAIALTTGEHAAFLFLVGTRKIEATQIGARIDFSATHSHQFIALAHHLIHTFGGVDILVLLVHVSQFYGFSHREGAAIGRFKSHNEAEKGGFSHAVGPNHTNNAGRREGERQIFVEHFIAKGFGNAIGFNHIIA